MKTSQKGFAPVVLAVIVGILVVGGYITYRYSAQRAVSNSATETKLSAVPDVVTAPAPIQPAVVTPATQKPADETSNWQTYRNEQYGFEFKYPSDLTTKNINSSLNKSTTLIFPQSYFSDPYITSAVIDIQTTFGNDIPSDAGSTLTINGLNWSRTDFSGDSGDSGGFYRRISYTLYGGHNGLINRNVTFNLDIFSKDIFSKGKVEQNLVATFDQILSTFKFTDSQTVVSGLKTYTNPEYGITFQYPAHYDDYPLVPKEYADKILPVFQIVDPAKSVPDLIDVSWLPFNTGKSSEQVLMNDVVFDGSGTHPTSFDSFTLVHLGDNDFYKIRTGLFEGVLGYKYYLVKDDGAFVFKMLSNNVHWTTPGYNPETDARYLELQDILRTVKLSR